MKPTIREDLYLWHDAYDRRHWCFGLLTNMGDRDISYRIVLTATSGNLLSLFGALLLAAMDARITTKPQLLSEMLKEDSPNA